VPETHDVSPSAFGESRVVNPVRARMVKHPAAARPSHSGWATRHPNELRLAGYFVPIA
jgi:hypothetical protein